jgi:23S rRNA (uracil1939-C5)-methyltransferase
MAERLYGLVRDFAALTGEENVYDLYCGTGTIGLSLARDAAAIWGLEISEEAVACAIENAELNGIENASFFAGNVGQTIEELAERAGAPDVAVVDPPRAGLAGKALRRTGRSARPAMYVSCNPTTLLGRRCEETTDTLVRCRPVDSPHAARRVVSLLTRDS